MAAQRVNDSIKKLLKVKKSKMDRLIVKNGFNLENKQILELSKEIDKLIVMLTSSNFKYIVM